MQVRLLVGQVFSLLAFPHSGAQNDGAPGTKCHAGALKLIASSDFREKHFGSVNRRFVVPLKFYSPTHPCRWLFICRNKVLGIDE